MQFLSLGEVARLTGLSPSTIWRAEKRGDFPRRVRIGLNRVGWLCEEVNDWAIARIQIRDRANQSSANLAQAVEATAQAQRCAVATPSLTSARINEPPSGRDKLPALTIKAGTR